MHSANREPSRLPDIAMLIRRPRHPLRVLTLFGLAVFICALFLLVPEAQTPNALGRNDLLNRLDREVFKKCQLHPTTEACLLNSTIFHTIANEGGNCSLKVLTKNCPVFLMAHRYLEVPVSQEEKAFPLAFSVRMHRSPAQMERLLRAIYRPHNFYCIHVDAKAEAEVYDIIAAVGACVPNVNVLVDRVRISYGTHGDGIVRADLKCMQAALASQVKWMYLLTLCGEEFPLRTNLEIVTILKLFRGANDVEAYQHPRNILRWFFGSVRRRGDVYKNGVLTLKSSPGSLQFVVKKGSAYASYTRQFVQAVFEDKRAKTILGWFNDTFAPEENVWATINAMPGIPGGYPVDAKHELNQQASRAVVWARDRYKCKGENVHSVCVFGMGDLPWLSRQPQFFANKFKEEKDSRVLDCLEARLFQRAVSADAAVNYSYFEGLPHVRFYRNRGGPINV